MQRLPRKVHGGATLSWNTAAVFILAQLLTVLVVYSLHQRSIETKEAGGVEAWAPSDKETSLLDRPTIRENFNKVPSVRLHEADAELLRRELSSMVSSIIYAQALRDAAENSTGAGTLVIGEGGPALQTLPRDPTVPRLSDEDHRPNPTSNIPGVQDLHAELQEYTARMLGTWTPNFSEAVTRQSRPKARELGLHVEDPMDDVASINTRIEFLNDLAEEMRNKVDALVSIATTSSVDLFGVRKEILPWLQYHTELGVTKFYILYDGHDPAAVESLRAVRHVELIHIHAPWASPVEVAMWEAQSTLGNLWQGTKGNYDLMNKQGFCLQEALRRARSEVAAVLGNTTSSTAGAVGGTGAGGGAPGQGREREDGVSTWPGGTWLMHLDPDELFLPGGHDASLAAELARQPAYVPAVRFLNFEGQPEIGDVINRFEQVTLFRVHKHFITPEAFWYRNRFKLGENAAFLYLYANGKSAVRVDAPGSRPSGPHYFTGDASPRWITPENPEGAWFNYVSDTAVVLHYAYTHPSEVAAKAHRSCPGKYGSTGGDSIDRKDVKNECFVIDFDADAFMAAINGPKAVDDFFYSRNVLSEGAPVRCARADDAQQASGWCALSDISRFIHLMEKVGLMKRVLLPQALLRQHERAIKKRLRSRSQEGDVVASSKVRF